MIRFDAREAERATIEAAYSRIEAEGTIGRIWSRDHTVWKDRDDEISNRLGWLEAPEEAARSLAGWQAFAREARAEGLTNVLLLGMGGSSLAPEVIGRVFGSAADGLRLDVLDTTDPETVLRVAGSLPPERTLVLVSSKSGTTLETASLMSYAYSRWVAKLGRAEAGRRFAAITDPGSRLEEDARRLEFRRVFPGNPEIGGRFSVFSAFGLVPAVLLGVDAARLLGSAREAMSACRAGEVGKNAGARLGAALGALARSGRDKATFLLSPELATFGGWIEQLIAESTGKDGRGILPLVRATSGGAFTATEERFFTTLALRSDADTPARGAAIAREGLPIVTLFLDDPYDLGGQFYLWEFATAVAGAVLGINPFDQPNVGLSKKKTEAFLRQDKYSARDPKETPAASEPGLAIYAADSAPTVREGLRRFCGLAGPGDYAAILAFLPPSSEIVAGLRELAAGLETATGRPATYDFGPRFLHSTGQLHKGDAGKGLFFQLTADHSRDVAVPVLSGSEGQKETTFGRLIDAQALGDREALGEKKRRFLRVHLGEPVAESLGRLAALLGG
jgi:glucose-6-phosphate isomerase